MTTAYETWLQTRTVCDPEICGGDRTIRGTRIAVRFIGGAILQNGQKSVDELREDFDYLRLTEIDLIYCAAWMVDQER